ncbi:hypothetical protein RhiJN_09208 [Ceratobasidium sp. AG-Ba]|nr:hypothetical protein RhiJN_09208 [Ceratobasidium sp. AG-Ba]QRW09973.1 hypothetical protein RhiLY_08972 [Ceratobasidium sp. AG-Ba]
MTTPVFSSVMWAPSDKYGSLVTRRRGSGTVARTAPGRRGSIDTCARSASNKACAAPPLGHRAEPDRRAVKTVRWLEDYKYPTDKPKADSYRMPVPVVVQNTPAFSKPSQPPACLPFKVLELPVYHPDDVRSELTNRLVKTLNDVVPLGQTYPILSPGCVHIQHELISITRELTNISAARLNFIADNIPDILRRIRRLTNNILATTLPATQYEAEKLQGYADSARQIRKTQIY